jgi:hypothetical protein
MARSGAGHLKLCRRGGLAAAMLGLFLSVSATTALADPKDDLLKKIEAIRTDSAKVKKDTDKAIQDAKDLLDDVEQNFGKDSPEYKTYKKLTDLLIKAGQDKISANQTKEDFQIAVESAVFRDDLYIHDKDFPGAVCCFAGEALIDGVAGNGHAEEGQDISLSFRFLDLATGLPATGAPAISSVLYRINRDPTAPDLFDLLGSSSDAGGGFAFHFTLDSYEPLFEAIPLDAAGAPIFLPGFGTENEAIAFVADIPLSPLSVPEPATWALLLLGLGATGAALRKRGVPAQA